LALQDTIETAKWTTDTELYSNARRWPVEIRSENENVSAIVSATGTESQTNDTNQHLTTAALVLSPSISLSRRGFLVQFTAPEDCSQTITETLRFLSVPHQVVP
jgi:hypothetical protein